MYPVFARSTPSSGSPRRRLASVPVLPGDREAPIERGELGSAAERERAEDRVAGDAVRRARARSRRGGRAPPVGTPSSRQRGDDRLRARRRRAVAAARHADLAGQQLGREVVARREHAGDDVGERRRGDRADLASRPAGVVPVVDVADGDAALARAAPRAARRRCSAGSSTRVVPGVAVVDGERAERADVVDVARLPVGQEAHVVVAAVVADDRAVTDVDARSRRSRRRAHASGVIGSVAVRGVSRRPRLVRGRREHRVTGADEVERCRRVGRARTRHERVVGAERGERGRPVRSFIVDAGASGLVGVAPHAECGRVPRSSTATHALYGAANVVEAGLRARSVRPRRRTRTGCGAAESSGVAAAVAIVRRVAAARAVVAQPGDDARRLRRDQQHERQRSEAAVRPRRVNRARARGGTGRSATGARAR